MSNDLLSKDCRWCAAGSSRRPRKCSSASATSCANAPTSSAVSARQRAAKLAKTYAELDENGRRAFLRILLTEFGPEPERIDAAYDAYRAARGSSEQWQAEAALRESLRSPRSRILTQFSASDAGVHFLVDLRAELLDFLRDDPLLAALDLELQGLLASWFDVALLELQRITWHSPADVLERLMQYEAVHEIESWQDLKNRLDSDRRCYAFFHPRMPSVPLIFVEVALTEGLAGDVQQLLDVSAPLFATERADTAIFYSISNTQKGLRGISFGHFLLKRVIDDLRRDFPKLERFATLSPIPGLVRWYRAHPEALADAFTASDWRRLHAAGAPRRNGTAAAAARDTRDRRHRSVARGARRAALARRSTLSARHRNGRALGQWRASTWATARSSNGSTGSPTPRPKAGANPGRSWSTTATSRTSCRIASTPTSATASSRRLPQCVASRARRLKPPRPPRKRARPRLPPRRARARPGARGRLRRAFP